MKRQWLIDARKARGLTQQQVAQSVRMSQGNYADLELGTRGSRIASHQAKGIAQILGFDWTKFYE